jgi:hypothetical protein
MQCAEYQDGIWVVNGIMAMHQQIHLHNFSTYLLECKQPKLSLAETTYHSPPQAPAICQPLPNHPQILLLTCPCFTFFMNAQSHNIIQLSLSHPPNVSNLSSLLMNYQILMKAAHSRCFMEGEINWQVNLADWNIMQIYGV